LWEAWFRCGCALKQPKEEAIRPKLMPVPFLLYKKILLISQQANELKSISLDHFFWAFTCDQNTNPHSCLKF